MNLEGFEGGRLWGNDALRDAPLEDRWLASVAREASEASQASQASQAIDDYRYAELARVLYGFAWDEFCSAYLELSKSRLAALADLRARSPAS